MARSSSRYKHMRMNGDILVVDDDVNVLEILEKSLSKNGYKVRVAKNGEEALNIYRESEPDMLVIDVVLPDMDGRDLLRILRSIPGKTHVPANVFNVITALDSLELLNRPKIREEFGKAIQPLRASIHKEQKT